MESDLFSYDSASKKVEISVKLKSCMYYYLTRNLGGREQNIFPHFHNNFKWGNEETIEKNNHKFISQKSLYNIYPDNINSKIDMTLANLVQIIKYLGNTIEITRHGGDEKYYHIFFIDDTLDGQGVKEKQLYGLLNIIKQYGLIEQVSQSVGQTDFYTLTAKGWMTVGEYLRKNETKKQAFIAMWFDKNGSMEDTRATIINAITDSGYLPMIIDIKEHNNQIVPEIFYEIRQSNFVIADLTGHRNGVYYEAGYAEALGKPVILSCKESDFDNRHFDVAQKNTIVWKDQEDLYKRLVDRITATVGSLKKNR